MKKAKDTGQMAKLHISFLAFLIFNFSFTSIVFAQTGGAFSITQSVIAGGGNSSSSGTYSLTATTGQAVAGGQQTNPPYSMQNGFWTQTFAPTAATVSVSGRVVTADGRGIRNVRVTITNNYGTTQTILTGPFGYFRFDELAAGETYIFSVTAKRFRFAQPTQVLTVVENIDDLVFTAF